MRSRAVSLTLGAVAWIALGAAAFFLVQSEKHIAEKLTAVRAFDVRAREATDALSDLRAAQQAYVAAGQGPDFWMPKVTATVNSLTATIAGLAQSAGSPDARSALDETTRTIAEFTAVDNRVRDYINGDQQLMAADVVFTEGGETAKATARHVETARLAEHQAFDRFAAAGRKQEAIAVTAAAGLAALAIALLVAGRSAHSIPTPEVETEGLGLVIERAPSASETPSPVLSPRPDGTLTAAAALCTDFGRIGSLGQLQGLLARAADLMDASGLVVWLGDAEGGDMRPVLAHGYGPQALARMPAVPRSDNNAAAAAYRAGAFQIVPSRPGSAGGAVVAPLLSPDGCIGALCAEIRDGGETSENVQALATLFAAQLAGVVATTSESTARTAGQGM